MGAWHRAHALCSDDGGRLGAPGKTGLEFEMMLTNRRNGLKTIRYNSKGQVPRAGLGREANPPSEWLEGRAESRQEDRAEPWLGSGQECWLLQV